MEPTKQTTRDASIGSTTGSTVGGQMPGISGDAKELASDAVDRAKEMANERLTEAQEKSAGQLTRLASALHHTSDELGDSVAAPYVEKAASLLDKLSGSVREATVRDALSATERFARREPLLFLGGAFTFGLLAARFLKSSGRGTKRSP
jgi:hypothetical protein